MIYWQLAYTQHDAAAAAAAGGGEVLSAEGSVCWFDDCCLRADDGGAADDDEMAEGPRRGADVWPAGSSGCGGTRTWRRESCAAVAESGCGDLNWAEAGGCGSCSRIRICWEYKDQFVRLNACLS